MSKIWKCILARRKIRSIGELFLDVVLLALVLTVIFDHIRIVVNSSDLTIPGVLENLRIDISDYPWVYCPFFVIFGLWLIMRIVRIFEEDKRDREQADIIEHNNQTLIKIEELLNAKQLK